MDGLPHLRMAGTEQAEDYTFAGGGGGGDDKFKRPDRPKKDAHARIVRKQLQDAQASASTQRTSSQQKYPMLTVWEPEGVVLTFESEPEFDLSIDSLDRPGVGIQIVSLKLEGDVQVAKVFVPEDRLGEFLKLVNDYARSVILKFRTAEANEALLVEKADPDNGSKKYRATTHKDGHVTVGFLVDEAKEAEFKAHVGDFAVLVETQRKNDKLIESIANVRLALVRDFWQDTLEYPDEDAKMWFEVWLRGYRHEASEVHQRFKGRAAAVGITQVSDRYVSFPERIVVHAYTSAKRLAASIDLIAMLGELRKAKELATHYVEMDAREQREYSDDLLERLTRASDDAPRVTILDGGVHRNHPLLEIGLAEEAMHTAVEDWGVSDSFPNQHGTGMAGNALYGCLTEILASTNTIILRHCLESVKILPPPPAENSPPDYGRIMQDGVALAYIGAAERNRVLCMAVTAVDRDRGLPSLWSGAVDDMCFGTTTGKQMLMFVSAGNIRDEFETSEYVYHDYNCQKGHIDDPGQAWNALTVGAITDKVWLETEFKGWEPLADAGDLSPRSRTSLPWPDDNQKGWPTKPDIVMEGGNYLQNPSLGRIKSDDLSLLTTCLRNGRLFDTTHDTSPATALASRFAAIIWSYYPKLWPETVRALMIHSAKWNDKMLDRFPRDTKSEAQRRLRCYGYGVPDLGRALASAENKVTLIYEGELQPFQKRKSEYRSFEMHVHQLPWPIEVLEEYDTLEIKMRITLSYFIEPSPGSVGWSASDRYASHGLRFDVIRLTENLEMFKQRKSRDFWDPPNVRPTNQAEDSRNWLIGENGRTHGSIHSDWWVGRAVDLAKCENIVVYPTGGWWRDRPHLGQYDAKARYSMIISLETENEEVKLYTPIVSLAKVTTEIIL